MKNSNFTLFALSLALLVSAGCNGNVGLGGKITYTDGSPLDVGTICFETDNFVARGTIKQDGTYKVGSLSETDGLPRGTYRVYFSGAEKIVPGDKGGAPKRVPLINPKYTSSDGSGLTLTVPVEGGKADFQLERYTASKK